MNKNLLSYFKKEQPELCDDMSLAYPNGTPIRNNITESVNSRTHDYGKPSYQPYPIDEKYVPNILNYKGGNVRDFKKYADRNKVTDIKLPESQLTKDKTDCKVYSFRGNFVTDCKKDIEKHQKKVKLNSLFKQLNEINKEENECCELPVNAKRGIDNI